MNDWITFLLAVCVLYLIYYLVQSYRKGAAERNDLSLHELQQAPSLPKRIRQGTHLLVDLPREYDVRVAYPFYSPRRIDQTTCGSCWSMAATYCMEERMQIMTNGRSRVRLAPQYLLNCQHYCEDILDPETCDAGCNGGYLEHAWAFLRDKGCPEENCVPFVNRREKCVHKCQNGEPLRLYRAREAYSITDPSDDPETNMKRIQMEILENGPVTAGMEGWKCFREWRGDGVYRQEKGTESIGGHAVRLIGWGESEKEGRYWIGVNSWGDHWGDGGFFRIARGVNECDIEDDVSAGIPELG